MPKPDPQALDLKAVAQALRLAIPHIQGTIDRARKDKRFVLISSAKVDLELAQEALAAVEQAAALPGDPAPPKKA